MCLKNELSMRSLVQENSAPLRLRNWASISVLSTSKRLNWMLSVKVSTCNELGQSPIISTSNEKMRHPPWFQQRLRHDALYKSMPGKVLSNFESLQISNPLKVQKLSSKCTVLIQNLLLEPTKFRRIMKCQNLQGVQKMGQFHVPISLAIGLCFMCLVYFRNWRDVSFHQLNRCSKLPFCKITKLKRVLIFLKPI